MTKTELKRVQALVKTCLPPPTILELVAQYVRAKRAQEKSQ